MVFRELLKMVWDEVSNCDIIDSKDEINLKLIQRPELGITFTKLHCWRLTQYSKCAFIDSDAVVSQDLQERAWTYIVCFSERENKSAAHTRSVDK
jgi:glycogenin